MSDEQRILAVLLEHGSLESEDQKVRGIAQRAIDEGYENLSILQQGVLKPFITRKCEGVENPGGHHNNCENILEGPEFVQALTNEAYYDAVLCESCVDEREQYSREWEKIQAE